MKSTLRTHSPSVQNLPTVEGVLTGCFNENINCLTCERDFSDSDFSQFSLEFWDFETQVFQKTPSHLLMRQDNSIGLNNNTIKDGDTGFRLLSLQPLEHFLTLEYGSVFKDENFFPVRCPDPLWNAFLKIRQDFNFLAQHGFRPQTRFVKSYVVNQSDAFDVNQFHVDRIGWKYGRMIACYNQPTTEYVHPKDALIHPFNHSVRVVSNAEILSLKAGAFCRIASKTSPGTNPFAHRGTNAAHPRVLTIAHRIEDEPRPV